MSKPDKWLRIYLTYAAEQPPLMRIVTLRYRDLASGEIKRDKGYLCYTHQARRVWVIEGVRRSESEVKVLGWRDDFALRTYTW